jgi:hypothetical protein
LQTNKTIFVVELFFYYHELVIEVHDVTGGLAMQMETPKVTKITPSDPRFPNIFSPSHHEVSAVNMTVRALTINTDCARSLSTNDHMNISEPLWLTRKDACWQAKLGREKINLHKSVKKNAVLRETHAFTN